MEKRAVGRPPTIATSLYGPVKMGRIKDYLDDSDKRWSNKEIEVLVKRADNATIAELLKLLPGRTDIQVRRMLEFLSS